VEFIGTEFMLPEVIKSEELLLFSNFIGDFDSKEASSLSNDVSFILYTDSAALPFFTTV
jgi:hypothetical protein